MSWTVHGGRSKMQMPQPNLLSHELLYLSGGVNLVHRLTALHARVTASLNLVAATGVFRTARAILVEWGPSRISPK
jgi:hypothetical protein